MSTISTMRKLLTLLLLPFALVATACAPLQIQQIDRDDFIVVETPAPALVDLEDIDQLQAAFNIDHGAPRILLLLSPT